MKHKTIPVHILTGFLGTGKTTLLNKLLALPQYANTLVIINEFGSVSIDHHLVKTSTETLYELSNGCLCCSIRGELAETLLSLDNTEFERVIIETTGIADPLPVFQTLALDEIKGKGMHPGSILAVFDNVRGRELLDVNEEASRQVALADKVYISRTDMQSNTDQTKETIKGINSACTIITDAADIALDEIPDSRDIPDLGKIKRHQSYSTILLEAKNPQSLNLVVGFLHHLKNQCGKKLLRVKGFAHCHETPKPLLIQMSGEILHDPVPLEEWPNNTPSTQLVAIGSDMDVQSIETLFKGYFSVTDIDTPDHEALSANPLAIPGMN